MIHVEVVFAAPKYALMQKLSLDPGARVQDALDHVTQLPRFKDVVVEAVGIWGELCEPHTQLNDGDRVEIYRPLIHDAKAARRLRAETQTSNKS